MSTEHNWPEDFSHENGNYNNECYLCKVVFVGHKRRKVCRVCANPKSIHAEADALREENARLKAEAEKLRGALDNDGKKIRWLWSDREYSIEDVESDCENADYSLGSINVVRYAVAVEIPDEWYVWWEDNADSDRPDVRQLWGPFKTKEEADAQKATLEARQADAKAARTAYEPHAR